MTKRILITSGPTREYLDPVRFLTNGSTGRMGVALAEAALKQGLLPVIVSGPVSVDYPDEAEVHWVETTEQMLERCAALYPQCFGVVGAAAPCDFKPVTFSQQKLKKESDGAMTFSFEETSDILVTLGQMKTPNQLNVGFALETKNGEANALEKMRRKKCRFIVLNSPSSIGNDQSTFLILADDYRQQITGSKHELADALFRLLVPLIKPE